MIPIKTRQEAHAAIVAQGLSITEWAKLHGLNRHNVYAVLSGHSKGRRGQAHDAAVLLGLKEGVVRGKSKTPVVQAGPADKLTRPAIEPVQQTAEGEPHGLD